EGTLIQEEARRRAEEVISAARVEVERLQQQYEALRQQMLAFRRHWQAVLQAELDTLRAVEGAEIDGPSAGTGAAAGRPE
ncbi:MAG: hypothetical protein H5U01_03465, partial [Clostridia bacterium]|nr:hypothetical protein [Clostridia bacterium]